MKRVYPFKPMTEEKSYKFKFSIETEDGEVLYQDSTYLNPESISEYGECESVDMETGKYLRVFKKNLEKETV